MGFTQEHGPQPPLDCRTKRLQTWHLPLGQKTKVSPSSFVIRTSVEQT